MKLLLKYFLIDKTSVSKVFLALFCVISFHAFSSCSSGKKDFAAKRDDVIRGISTSVDKSKTRLLIVSNEVCHVCFEEAIQILTTNPIGESLGIVILGNSQEENRRLNLVYGRRGIHFITVDNNLYRSLYNIDSQKAISIFVGVRVNGKTIHIYDGEGEFKTLSERTYAVVKHILE